MEIIAESIVSMSLKFERYVKLKEVARFSTLEQKLFVVMVWEGCCITKTIEEIWLGHHWFGPKIEGEFCFVILSQRITIIR